MSNKCGNCDCADVSQCVRKESQYDLVIVERSETVVMNVGAAEHDGKCKCGSSCACVNCTCGH
ncbi:metallothionein-like protein type 3 [Lycium barbarum]|uniref:metallothionein-like protein type 3 n=1 Tax=Lycium barbarum TaxID=112863 RepID=UPI00293E8EEA|nr:metallothionein-like protein type 3 [Lycium barbarum]